MNIPGLRSLRAQLIVWNSLILALLLSVLGGALLYVARAVLLASVDRELERRTHRFVEGPGPGHGPPPGSPGMLNPPPGPPPFERREWRGGGPGPGPFFPREPDQDAKTLRPRLLNRQGQAMAPQDASAPWDAAAFSQALQGQETFSTIVVDGEPVRIFSCPFPRGGQPEGVVQAPYSLSDVNRALSSVNRALLLVLPIGLLSAGLGGALLTSRALRPVRRLTQTAAHIGAQDLSRRLAVTGQDEFSELAGTFNGMLARLEKTFQKQKHLVQQLEELVEQQRRFTADASHELRTPLTVIKANTSLYRGGKPSEEEYQQSIEDIDRAAEAMSRLVNDLLLLSRSDSGQLGHERIALPIREALERAAASIRRQEAAPLLLEIPDSALCVLGNEAEIVRLFTNLLDNAARYTPLDGQIRVTAMQEANRVRITVTDTGIGIAPEHLAHLGERFYRVDASRARPDGGTGLGLSICKSIVEAHEGTLSFQSVVGAGTTVTVLLPAA